MFHTDRVAELSDRIRGKKKIPEFSLCLQINRGENDVIMDMMSVDMSRCGKGMFSLILAAADFPLLTCMGISLVAAMFHLQIKNDPAAYLQRGCDN